MFVSANINSIYDESSLNAEIVDRTEFMFLTFWRSLCVCFEFVKNEKRDSIQVLSSENELQSLKKKTKSLADRWVRD